MAPCAKEHEYFQQHPVTRRFKEQGPGHQHLLGKLLSRNCADLEYGTDPWASSAAVISPRHEGLPNRRSQSPVESEPMSSPTPGVRSTAFRTARPIHRQQSSNLRRSSFPRYALQTRPTAFVEQDGSECYSSEDESLDDESMERLKTAIYTFIEKRNNSHNSCSPAYSQGHTT
ncbi:hypothetical protein AJ79_02403 [Helicocarpus griseus UAMH5409]|uniref:Uncharacterized protein n=1 Tax=Helicocarpus griseus UAMH5409 TaxID=1447875 RepID=A0A2B7Y427_9EURO|nr:hypothetical protein AJ79_02403 [Helicocarpus griseus UAMH5409]